MTSAMPRPILLSVPSNRMAAAGFLLSLILGRKLSGNWAGGVRCAVNTFGAWSLTRELDPDFPVTFEQAVIVGLLGSSYLSYKSAAPVTWSATLSSVGNLGSQLASVRQLTATVGPAPTLSDSAQLVAAAGLNARAGQSVAALLPMFSLGLSTAQQDRHSPESGLEVTLAAALASALPAAPTLEHAPQTDVLTDLLSLAALGLGYTLARPEAVSSRCDIAPVKVSAQRLQASRALAVAAVGTLLLRRESVQAFPLAIACTVVGLRRLSR